MVKKNFMGCIALALTFFIVFTGCATMFRTNTVNVVSMTGATSPVRVLENGMPIFEGNLPASFSVRSGRTYSIVFATTDGEQRTISVSQRFNGWFIGSILLGLLPAIVDLATGSVMTFEGTAVVPISHFPTIILGENIEMNSDLRIIGNINDIIEEEEFDSDKMWLQNL